MSALRQIFTRVHFRYEQDPYAPDLEPFAAWLLSAGYRNKSARRHLFHVQQALHAIGAPPGSPLSEGALAHGFRRRGKVSSLVYRHTRGTYSRYLRSVSRLIEAPSAAPDPVAVELEQFCARLTRRRGLAVSTIAGYRHWISDFLTRTLAADRPLSALSSADLEAYVQARGRQLAPHTFRTAIQCIQGFLLDCHQRGQLTERIEAVDLPRGFRSEQPPRALPWPLLQRFLRTIARTDRVGARDYAILHLMAHYGLRPGELAHLTLDSIDWSAATLCVRQTKTLSTLIVPLHARTLRLLRAYLQRSRHAAALPWLFLRANAPEAPMSKYSLSYVFRTRARRSGLPLEGYSAYSLRHGFALRLFQRGVGMKAIGDLMGHRSLLSTAVYIRLQTDALREVALPVPGQQARAGGVV